MMIELNFTTIMVCVLTLTSGALGWFARELWSAVKELQKDLVNFRIQVSENYVRYDKLQDALKPIMDSLVEIKETLKDKADK